MPVMKAIAPLAAVIVLAFGLAAPAQAERDAFEEELTRNHDYGNVVHVDHKRQFARRSDSGHKQHFRHNRHKKHFRHQKRHGHGYGYGHRKHYGYDAPYQHRRHRRYDGYYGHRHGYGHRHRHRHDGYGHYGFRLGYGHRHHYGGSHFALSLVLPLRSGYGGQDGYVAYEAPRRLSAETVAYNMRRDYGLYVGAVKYQAGLYYVWGQEPSGRSVKLHVNPVGGVIVAKYYLD